MSVFMRLFHVLCSSLFVLIAEMYFIVCTYYPFYKWAFRLFLFWACYKYCLNIFLLFEHFFTCLCNTYVCVSIGYLSSNRITGPWYMTLLFTAKILTKTVVPNCFLNEKILRGFSF